MALPFTFEDNFETGATSFDNGEVDTQGRFTVRRYDWMPKNNVAEVPFRGAYCAVVDLSGGVNDAYVNHAAMNLSADAETFFRFYLYAEDLTMGTDDRMTIFRLVDANGVEEVCCELRENGGITQIGVAETNTATGSWVQATENKWHAVELAVVLDDGASNDGSIVLFLDNVNTGVEVTGLDQAAITDGHFGVMNQDVNTTAGIIMLDMFAQDDTRVFPVSRRFHQIIQITKTSHVALGPATLGSVTLTGTGGDEELQVYDSDDALNTSGGEFNQVMPPLRIGASDDVSRSRDGERIDVEKGVYCVLSGTEPLATIEILDAQSLSVAGIRNLGIKRR